MNIAHGCSKIIAVLDSFNRLSLLGVDYMSVQHVCPTCLSKQLVTCRTEAIFGTPPKLLT